MVNMDDLNMDDFSPAQREAMESVTRRIVERAIVNARGALKTAGLDATLKIEQFDHKFDIVLQCTKLPPDQRKLAEDITNAALESVILQASVDGKLH